MNKKKQIKIIAHKGAQSLAPENTLAAFRKAHELGIQSVELDVHMSKDGVLVIHHDYSLGKPDNGKGLISSVTLDTIRQADAGSWFSSKFVAEKIPTLEEVFIEFGRNTKYEVELKGTSSKFVDQVFELVDAHKLVSHIEFTSPHVALLCYIAQLRKDTRCGIFFSEYKPWMSPETEEQIILDTLTLASAQVAHIPEKILTSTLVETLHRNDFLVHVANCNTEEAIRKALSFDVDQFSTNDVVLAKKIVDM